MAAPILRATVTKGLLRWDEPARVAGYLGKHEGKRVRVTVERESVRRTNKANAYLWAGVYASISEWSGFEVDEVHELCKAMFLPKRQVTLSVTGELLDMPGSTTELSIEEFTEYIRRIKSYFAERGLYIPSSEEMVA